MSAAAVIQTTSPAPALPFSPPPSLTRKKSTNKTKSATSNSANRSDVSYQAHRLRVSNRTYASNKLTPSDRSTNAKSATSNKTSAKNSSKTQTSRENKIKLMGGQAEKKAGRDPHSKDVLFVALIIFVFFGASALGFLGWYV
eukprot:CAMPEP_0119323908 /NCGR_PEP_ID=MMETSP1333-20130426/61921_1 /TAXON_ID=418940 /ORGANISM="Scyphosphaera apsteinii, Strain RCC1455" /LENGTH=141 /DNA_ID=CAMNT_0007331475 /DNA_START=105 /DNA_END=526 /DNA_ORIENTATION=-